MRGPRGRAGAGAGAGARAGAGAVSDSDGSEADARDAGAGASLNAGRPAKRRRRNADDSDDGEGPAAGAGSAEMGPEPGDAETRAFAREIDRISARHCGALDGVLDTIALQVRARPNSRVLVCFGYQGTTAGGSAINSLMRGISRTMPRAAVYDVNQLMKAPDKAEVALVEFADDTYHPDPVIFVLNTTSATSNVQGMDLWRTDLTILMANCTQSVQKQAIGRSLRMRPRPADMPAKARFPYKRLVIAHLINGAT